MTRFWGAKFVGGSTAEDLEILATADLEIGGTYSYEKAPAICRGFFRFVLVENC